MAPEPGQETEEKQVPRAPADGEPVSGDLGPPTGTPTDTVVPQCPQNTKTHSTRLAPEALDPRTLRLLWEQRELEIQALRWAIRNGPHARHCHILQEVSGLPSERSFHSPDKFLQDQVEKLTLELKAQKEQAQLEKEHLEEQLMQTVNMLQQLEAQLQAFQKSCLLQLACSSWLGRVLRSQTGSVEVVTAETLRDSGDFSENESPPAGEGFQLEDVDWNSIAHRYPNLFIDSSTRLKQPQQSPSLEKGGSDPSVKHMEKHSKSLEWSSLCGMGTSSSGGASSDSSSSQLVLHSGVQKASGYPPQAEGLASSEQIPTKALSVSGDSEDLVETHSQPLSKTAGEPCTAPEHRRASHQLSAAGSCLKIVAVSRREKFIRVLNPSLEQTVDLHGFVLQQLERGCPACVYRFPPGTLLAPRHHVTVWGERPGTKKPPSSSGQGAGPVHSGLGCVTLLLSPEGQVLSEHRTPHRVAPGSGIFADNTDWSIDRFPLPEAPPSAGASKPQSRPRAPRKSRVRVRETSARRRRPGMRDILPLLSTCQPFHLPEAQVRPENTQSKTLELLPPIPEAGLCPQDCPTRKERKVRVCRKNVDRSCPMVALSVQSTAESRYGFRFLSCPPITVDTCRRV